MRFAREGLDGLSKNACSSSLLLASFFGLQLELVKRLARRGDSSFQNFEIMFRRSCFWAPLLALYAVASLALAVGTSGGNKAYRLL